MLSDRDSAGTRRLSASCILPLGRFIRPAYRVVLGSIDERVVGLERDRQQRPPYRIMPGQEQDAANIEQNAGRPLHSSIVSPTQWARSGVSVPPKLTVSRPRHGLSAEATLLGRRVNRYFLLAIQSKVSYGTFIRSPGNAPRMICSIVVSKAVRFGSGRFAM